MRRPRFPLQRQKSEAYLTSSRGFATRDVQGSPRVSQIAASDLCALGAIISDRGRDS